MRARLVTVVLAFLVFPPAAFAVEEADKGSIRQVIEQQIAAFLRDDAGTAYSFAAPNIKNLFPDQNMFMQMVRQGYPAVYRPKSMSFGETKDLDSGPAQVVDLIDAEGAAWQAVYTMERQPDGSWKITGCYLVRAPGVST